MLTLVLSRKTFFDGFVTISLYVPQILVLSRKAFFDVFEFISLYVLMKMLPALRKSITIVYSTTAEFNKKFTKLIIISEGRWTLTDCPVKVLITKIKIKKWMNLAIQVSSWKWKRGSEWNTQLNNTRVQLAAARLGWRLSCLRGRMLEDKLSSHSANQNWLFKISKQTAKFSK